MLTENQAHAAPITSVASIQHRTKVMIYYGVNS